MLHRLIESIRPLVEAFRRTGSGGQPQVKGSAGSRRNPWPRCQDRHHRVPVLHTSAPEGAEPCFFGIQCGCCYGTHRPAAACCYSATRRTSTLDTPGPGSWHH